ncbi:hypothetical protein K502DRAFT_368501 [Neoconidiobolus thromboides FSU 785]|nr:hypothetical protein K502DRAFT_368501 [Neoconidiobolus thromboides FSU 785]
MQVEAELKSEKDDAMIKLNEGNEKYKMQVVEIKINLKESGFMMKLIKKEIGLEQGGFNLQNISRRGSTLKQ